MRLQAFKHCYNFRMQKKHVKELAQLFSSIESEEEAAKLLKDLCTPQEIDSFAERWEIIQQLAARKTQREVAEKLGVSISKVTRGSRVLQYGEGGFELFLKKLQKAKE